MICRGCQQTETSGLTVLSVVEGPRHGFTRRVVASAHAALVIPGLGVENVVTAGLLRGQIGRGGGQEVRGRRHSSPY